MKKITIPQALYSCSNRYCAQEVSYPADMLYLHKPTGKWICDSCWEYTTKARKGITLADYIAKQQAVGVK